MSGHERLSEDEAYEIALNDHPDLLELSNKDDLPEEMIDDDGNPWNPGMHLQMHAVIEAQIANDEPTGIAGIAQRLAELGVDHHEIRHLMAQPLVDQIWEITRNDMEFDEPKYMRDQQKIVEDHS